MLENINSHTSIIDLVQFDLSNFFLQEYEEVNLEEIEGLFCIDYETELSNQEFDLFDIVRLRVFSRIKDIGTSDHVNITFYSKDALWSVKKLEILVNTLCDLYGKDDNGKEKLNSEEIADLKLNIFNRNWTLGTVENVHSIQITKKEKEGIELHIIFLKNMLRCLGKL